MKDYFKDNWLSILTGIVVIGITALGYNLTLACILLLLFILFAGVVPWYNYENGSLFNFIGTSCTLIVIIGILGTLLPYTPVIRNEDIDVRITNNSILEKQQDAYIAVDIKSFTKVVPDAPVSKIVKTTTYKKYTLGNTLFYTESPYRIAKVEKNIIFRQGGGLNYGKK